MIYEPIIRALARALGFAESPCRPCQVAPGHATRINVNIETRASQRLPVPGTRCKIAEFEFQPHLRLPNYWPTVAARFSMEAGSAFFSVGAGNGANVRE